MRIIRGWSTRPTWPATDPLLNSDGFFLEFRGGDVCDPINGNWFTAPFPTRVIRFFCKFPIFPFVSWRFKGWAGYLGAKIYGVDAEAYKNWMPESDVYYGSQALCFSARPFASAYKEDKRG